MIPQSFRSSPSEEPQLLPHAVYALPDHRPIPARESRAELPPEKVSSLTRWRPALDKNVNYPRAPSSRRSGLVGPYTTPPIVNYKYMTSTL